MREQHQQRREALVAVPGLVQHSTGGCLKTRPTAWLGLFHTQQVKVAYPSTRGFGPAAGAHNLSRCRPLPASARRSRYATVVRAQPAPEASFPLHGMLVAKRPGRLAAYTGVLISLLHPVRSMMPSSASTWTPMTAPSWCTPTTSAPSSSWTFARCVKHGCWCDGRQGCLLRAGGGASGRGRCSPSSPCPR